MAHFHGRSVREPRLSPSPVCSRWNSVSCSSSIALLPSSLPEFHIRLWLSPARRQVWVSLCIESIPPSPSSNSLWEEGRKEAYFLPHSPSCLPSVITMTVAEKEAGGRKQYETEINPARTSVSLSCLSASVSSYFHQLLLMDAFLYTSALSSLPFVDSFGVPFLLQYTQEVRWTITRSCLSQGDVPGVTTGQPQCYSCPPLSQLLPLSVCTSALVAQCVAVMAACAHL